jgi:GTPase SAR1 family protein
VVHIFIFNMSKPKGSADDLWTKLEAAPVASSGENAGDGAGTDTTTVFVGESGCGKSSLIQTFLKPTANKDPKPTFALEYNFARKKVTGQASSGKSVAHIWELGGDIYEPRLLDVAITTRNLSSTTVVICIDLSKPKNAFASLKKWIALIRGEVVKNRLAELKAKSPDEAKQMRDRAMTQYEENLNDRSKIKPCEVPLVVVGTKYDLFKANFGLSERRAVWQVIRCVAHTHGATVLTTSMEAGARDSLRNSVSAICFRTVQKNMLDVAPDKPVSVSPGKDDYAQIILSSLSDSTAAKSRLIYNESDVNSFFESGKGVSPAGWAKFADHLASLFGPPDPLPEAVGDAEEKRDENEFPEVEVDEMRGQRDIALQRYVQVMQNCRLE